MKMKVRKVHPDAILPKYTREGDAGMDIYTIEEYTLKPGERKLFKTGISYEMEPGFVSLIWDRSGLAINHGITTLGGVIEHTYRGELGIILLNTSDVEYHVEKGDKIANMLIQPIVTASIEELKEDDNFSESPRGKNAFGSSGRK
jgi:dUTP pyrophosphatase